MSHAVTKGRGPTSLMRPGTYSRASGFCGSKWGRAPISSNPRRLVGTPARKLLACPLESFKARPGRGPPACHPCARRV
eukprot:15472728-Alexandrium_andersonii.AAC.1